jgi:hypothetical protein
MEEQEKTYQSTTSKKGVFKLKSLWDKKSRQEKFELFILGSSVGVFESQGITDFFEMFEEFAEKYRVANK